MPRSLILHRHRGSSPVCKEDYRHRLNGTFRRRTESHSTCHREYFQSSCVLDNMRTRIRNNRRRGLYFHRIYIPPVRHPTCMRRVPNIQTRACDRGTCARNHRTRRWGRRNACNALRGTSCRHIDRIGRRQRIRWSVRSSTMWRGPALQMHVPSVSSHVP